MLMIATNFLPIMQPFNQISKLYTLYFRIIQRRQNFLNTKLWIKFVTLEFQHILTVAKQH